MIQLLENEEVLTDLYKGAIKNENEAQSPKTLLLTNKRLIVVENGNMGKSLFLNNIQSVAAQQSFNWAMLGPALIIGVFALVWLTNIIPQYNYDISNNTRTPLSVGQRFPLSLIMGIVAAALAFFAKQNRVEVSTSADRVRFALERRVILTASGAFVNQVLVEVDKVKRS